MEPQRIIPSISLAFRMADLTKLKGRRIVCNVQTCSNSGITQVVCVTSNESYACLYKIKYCSLDLMPSPHSKFVLWYTVTAASSTPPSPRQPPPEQHLPTSPKSPPPSWEGGAPKYQPASPDHPPPGWPTASADGDDNAGSFDSVYTPQSPASSPPTDGGYVPQSPTAPPPDIDSDEDENYDRALAEARSAVPPDVWEAYSPDEKKSCIDERMKMLEAAQGSPRL